MVAPKKVCFKDEDKSPSPQPFEEPEGMVTIDLNGEGCKQEEGTVSVLYNIIFLTHFTLIDNYQKKNHFVSNKINSKS